jgi:hypothetical protein
MADTTLEQILARDPEENEFHQAVQEVFDTIKPVLDHHPEYRKLGVLERITEPERVIMFRVPWMDPLKVRCDFILRSILAFSNFWPSSKRLKTP